MDNNENLIFTNLGNGALSFRTNNPMLTGLAIVGTDPLTGKTYADGDVLSIDGDEFHLPYTLYPSGSDAVIAAHKFLTDAAAQVAATIVP